MHSNVIPNPRKTKIIWQNLKKFVLRPRLPYISKLFPSERVSRGDYWHYKRQHHICYA